MYRRRTAAGQFAPSDKKLKTLFLLLCFFFSAERSTWNAEDEVESAVRPPSGQEASQQQQHHCNGLSEDSSSETSSYSENSRTTTVSSPRCSSAPLNFSSYRPSLLPPPSLRAPQWAGLLR